MSVTVEYRVERQVIFTGSGETVEYPDDSILSVQDGGEHRVVVTALVPVEESESNE